jgi:hypothetical protein
MNLLDSWVACSKAELENLFAARFYYTHYQVRIYDRLANVLLPHFSAHVFLLKLTAQK